MKEWATNISFVFWWSFFPNTTLSILSFQKTFFKSTMTSPLFCDYIHFIVCFLVVFSSFSSHAWLFLFFSWIVLAVEFFEESNLVHCNVAINCCLMRWLQALQLKHWWCARNIVNLPDLITSNTLTTVMEKAFQWRRALELLTEVGFLKGTPWKKWAKKSSQKTNTNGFLYQHPSRRVVFFSPIGVAEKSHPSCRVQVYWESFLKNQSEMRSSMHKSCA